MSRTDHARNPRNYWDRMLRSDERIERSMFPTARPVLTARASIAEQLIEHLDPDDLVQAAECPEFEEFEDDLDRDALGHLTPVGEQQFIARRKQLAVTVEQDLTETLIRYGISRSRDYTTETPVYVDEDSPMDWESVLHAEDFRDEHLLECPDCARSHAETYPPTQMVDDRWSQVLGLAHDSSDEEHRRRCADCDRYYEAAVWPPLMSYADLRAHVNDGFIVTNPNFRR